MESEFRIRIETGNDAFDQVEQSEVARILREVADKVEQGNSSGGILDANGNKVGQFGLEQDI